MKPTGRADCASKGGGWKRGSETKRKWKYRKEIAWMENTGVEYTGGKNDYGTASYAVSVLTRKQLFSPTSDGEKYTINTKIQSICKLSSGHSKCYNGNRVSLCNELLQDVL